MIFSFTVNKDTIPMNKVYTVVIFNELTLLIQQELNFPN